MYVEIQRLREQRDMYHYNGCLTGDCPHSYAEGCVEAMVEIHREIEESAAPASVPEKEQP